MSLDCSPDEFPIDVPPILPDVQEQLQNFITNIRKLPIHDYEKTQQHWNRNPDPYNLLFYDVTKVPSVIRSSRDPKTGELKELLEVNHDGLSLKGNEFDIQLIPNILKEAAQFDVLKGKELLVKPNSLSRGFDFSKTLSEKTELQNEVEEPNEDNCIIDLAQLLKGTVVSHDLEPAASDLDKPTEKFDISEEEASSVLETLTKDVKFNPPVLNISTAPAIRGAYSTEWAEMLDVSNPVADFHKRIPNPAFKYEFELDTFQKQAILKLEEHCNVLVSAHTSAGKTVVAEYAIALSQRHLTRTIYTSPIKALSNQKYREFRQKFVDVGLVTGDFQVNPTGACLVVTTEILRSMLLAQNDVVRDLEFVIFDEVHYINDLDRGHVWEEVVILLPAHVSIVMLSATIPNALQFADWVGRVKQRRMYVVSTIYRPVPLKHYLYTGSGGTTKNERFLIMDNNSFKRAGYVQAVEAKKKRQSKTLSNPNDRQRLTLKQESTLWVALVEHLLSREELPVVAFTLSRKRCDANAESLTLDLTNAKEKSHIRQFFKQCVMRLNQADRNLPQILLLQKLLERGVGVHHSGILPILKEIVELLFQERCVKVLFATETFAMGVNMPAKTVVFDAITKFDGLTQRLLLPSEYIQMAGRAGRRGLDENGNVLLLCKGAVPKEDDLFCMMTGQPKKIESQFRLTYSIILKLERKRVAAEGKVTVEEMMANSFMESEHVKKKYQHETQLERVRQALEEASVSTEKGPSWQKFEEVSKMGLEFLDLWHELSPSVLRSKTAQKAITPGRVLLITHCSHVNKLGVLLALIDNKRAIKYRVLVLHEGDIPMTEDVTGFHKLIALTSTKIYLPSTLGGHVVLNIDPWDILDVTTDVIKFDQKIVLNDWENRQIPRFKDNAPGQSFQRVLEELVAITHKAQMTGKIETVPLHKDMAITTDQELQNVRAMTVLKEKIQSTSLEDIIDWEQQLEEVFRLRCLQKEKESLTYLLSYQSMSLYSDYQSRLEVLRALGYVDKKNSVQMKGNVACEMSNHELLITELVLRNTLNHLQPAEIAALLSCFVYQGSNTEETLNVSPALMKAVTTITLVEKEITETERQFAVYPTDPLCQDRNLNFSLVPIVYQWALEKPFSDIMALTDIQEGIIVRCIQQLNEVIKDVRCAARIIGEPTLQQKMEEASNAIKRDIVFAASLYMQ